MTAISILLVIVLIGVIGWQFNWWLAEKNVDRQVGIDNRQRGTQTAWHDEAIDLFNQADLIDDTPQAAALRRQACELAGRLTGPYEDDTIVEMEAAHC
jgi:hypothetical protein